MKKHCKSIRYQFLFTMLSVFLFFVTILLFIWYITLKTEAKSTAIANMKTTINVSNTTFENQITDIINVTALTTVRSSNNLSTNIINIMSRKDLSDADIVTYRNETRDYLISLCSFKKNLNGLMISDFHGNNVYYGIITPYDVILENNWLSNLNTTKAKTLFIEPHYSNQWYPNESDLVFSIIRPVYNFSNEKIGFAIADINCDLFSDSFDVNATNQASLYVIDSETGKVIFTPQKNILGIKEQSYLSNDVRAKLFHKSGDFFINSTSGKMLVVYNKSSLTGWSTLSVVPESDILYGFSSTAKKVILITILLITLLIICVYFLSSALTHNISMLTESVKQIGGNNLELNYTIKSNDEISDLAQQFRSMLTRIKQLLTEIKSSEVAKHKAEIAALQFQMNPHFLYNTLNTIKFLANIQGITNIETVAESLSSLMHTNMDGRSFITVSEDIAFIESYLAIQKYRHTNTIEYHITSDSSILKYLLPKLLIQPLIENSLKHGLPDRSTGGIIKINYGKKDSYLHITVEDNGIGMTDSQIHSALETNRNESAGHIGLHNINERLQLYFPNNFTFHVYSKPDQFTFFEITIPLILEEMK